MPEVWVSCVYLDLYADRIDQNLVQSHSGNIWYTLPSKAISDELADAISRVASLEILLEIAERLGCITEKIGVKARERGSRWLAGMAIGRHRSARVG